MLDNTQFQNLFGELEIRVKKDFRTLSEKYRLDDEKANCDRRIEGDRRSNRTVDGK